MNYADWICVFCGKIDDDNWLTSCGLKFPEGNRIAHVSTCRNCYWSRDGPKVDFIHVPATFKYYFLGTTINRADGKNWLWMRPEAKCKTVCFNTDFTKYPIRRFYRLKNEPIYKYTFYREKKTNTHKKT